MHSPTQAHPRGLLPGASPYATIALVAGGQVLAVAIVLLLYFSWGILRAFQEPLLWAWLCSLSLRDVKRYVVATARRELLTRWGGRAGLRLALAARSARRLEGCTLAGGAADAPRRRAAL